MKQLGPESLKEYLSLEFHFKPTEDAGILFYAGNSELETYNVVYLKHSFVYFQFDLGEGASVLR